MLAVVHEVLLVGQENAVTAAEICDFFGITRQKLSQIVRQERRCGWPICAISTGNYGYYLAADADEMKRFCDRLAHRAAEISATRDDCLKMIDCLPPGESEYINA